MWRDEERVGVATGRSLSCQLQASAPSILIVGSGEEMNKRWTEYGQTFFCRVLMLSRDEVVGGCWQRSPSLKTSEIGTKLSLLRMDGVEEDKERREAPECSIHKMRAEAPPATG